MEKEADFAVVDGHDGHDAGHVSHVSHDYDEISKQQARRGSKVNEATDMYGDVATAEEYGYVSRG